MIDRGMNVWWGTGRARFVLPGTGVTQGQTSRGQGDIPGRGNRTCAGGKAYKTEKCGVPWCRKTTGSDCRRGCQPESSGLVLPSSFLLRPVLLLRPPSSLRLLGAKLRARCWPGVWERSRSPGQGEGLCDQLQTQGSLWPAFFWGGRGGCWEELPKEDHGRTWGLAHLGHPWTC